MCEVNTQQKRKSPLDKGGNVGGTPTRGIYGFTRVVAGTTTCQLFHTIQKRAVGKVAPNSTGNLLQKTNGDYCASYFAPYKPVAVVLIRFV